MQRYTKSITADGDYIIPVQALGLPYKLVVKGEPVADDDGLAAWGGGTITLLAPLSPEANLVTLNGSALSHGNDERDIVPITDYLILRLSGATDPNLLLTFQRVQTGAPF